MAQFQKSEAEVLAYRVQCQEKEGDWKDAGMPLDSEGMEYRVIAENKAGASAPRNVVRAVL